jgi:hypothetical protein
LQSSDKEDLVMTSIRLGAFSAIAALGLLLPCGGIARADPFQANDLRLAVAASGHPCAGEAQSGVGCSLNSPGATHRHKVITYNALVKPRRATPNEPRPLVIAVNPSPATPGASCTGANAWSLLCPGSQLIGISY